MDGLVGAVSVGQGLPRRAGAHEPQPAVEDLPPIAPRPAAAIGPHGVLGEAGFDEVPLRFGQVHP